MIINHNLCGMLLSNLYKNIIGIGFLFTITACGQNNQSIATNTPINGEKTATHDSTHSANDTVHSSAGQLSSQETISLSPFLAPFVPVGYTVLDTTSGDLNLDTYPDITLVLKKNGEDTTSDVIDHPEKRPLLILLGQADHSYKMAAQNNNAVYCVDCGGMMGDPFVDIVIKKGYFSVEHYGGSGWRWTRTITFKYSTTENEWFLYKDGGDSFHAAEPDKVTTKIKTTRDFGKVSFEKFDIYKED